MADARGQGVRLGGGDGPRLPPLWLMAAGGAAVVAIAVVIIVLSRGGKAETAATGCRSDAECGEGRICAAGGCLFLLASEHPGIWRDDVAAQADGGVAWTQRPSAGESLLSTATCPAPVRKLVAPDEGKLTLLAKVIVYTVDQGRLRVYQYRRSKGEIWYDVMRFWFPDLKRLDTAQSCLSSELVALGPGQGSFRGAPSKLVDAQLKQAAPTGKTVAGAVSVATDLPPADAGGFRTLSFGLDPVYLDGARFRTVVALPLGSDVASLGGPPPDDQRLLKGFFAYYWEHRDAAAKVSVRFREPAVIRERLAVEQINP